MEISKKLEEAYVQRMPTELKEEFVALSANERARAPKPTFFVFFCPHHNSERKTNRRVEES
jgi:hypothetical protein